MRAEPRYKPLSIEAITLLSEGKVIEAVKVVRLAEGLGLKEAKGRVDAHIAQDPLLRVQVETQRRSARRRFFYWFLIVDLGITAAVIYWFFFRGAG